MLIKRESPLILSNYVSNEREKGKEKEKRKKRGEEGKKRKGKGKRREKRKKEEGIREKKSLIPSERSTRYSGDLRALGKEALGLLGF